MAANRMLDFVKKGAPSDDEEEDVGNDGPWRGLSEFQEDPDAGGFDARGFTPEAKPEPKGFDIGGFMPAKPPARFDANFGVPSAAPKALPLRNAEAGLQPGPRASEVHPSSDLASKMAFAAWKANNPGKDPNEFWSAREGNRGAGSQRVGSYDEPGRVGTGQGDTRAMMYEDIKRRAALGDGQANAKLAYLNEHPGMAQQMFGQDQFEIEADMREHAMRKGEAESRMHVEQMRLEGEQRRHIMALEDQKAAIADAVSKHQMSTQDAELALKKAEADTRAKVSEAQQAWNQRMGQGQLDLQGRGLALQEQEAADQRGRRLTPEQQQQLNTVSVAKAQREAAGIPNQEQTAQEEAKVMAAAQEKARAGDLTGAQAMIDNYNRLRKGRGQEAVAGSANVDVSDPVQSQNLLKSAGYATPDEAFKAGLDAVVRQDPQLRSAFGNQLSGSTDNWLFRKAPMKNPTYKAAVKDRVVREMVNNGVPAQLASKIANERVNQY